MSFFFLHAPSPYLVTVTVPSRATCFVMVGYEAREGGVQSWRWRGTGLEKDGVQSWRWKDEGLEMEGYRV